MIETIVLATKAENRGGECDCCLDHIHLLMCHSDVQTACTVWCVGGGSVSELDRSVITAESGDKKDCLRFWVSLMPNSESSGEFRSSQPASSGNVSPSVAIDL